MVDVETITYREIDGIEIRVDVYAAAASEASRLFCSSTVAPSSWAPEPGSHRR